MRTTVEIPDDLYREAKIAAARRGIRLRDLVEEGMRLALDAKPARGPRRLDFPLIPSAHPGSLTTDEVRHVEERAAIEEDLAHGRPV